VIGEVRGVLFDFWVAEDVRLEQGTGRPNQRVVRRVEVAIAADAEAREAGVKEVNDLAADPLEKHRVVVREVRSIY